MKSNHHFSFQFPEDALIQFLFFFVLFLLLPSLLKSVRHCSGSAKCFGVYVREYFLYIFARPLVVEEIHYICCVYIHCPSWFEMDDCCMQCYSLCITQYYFFSHWSTETAYDICNVLHCIRVSAMLIINSLNYLTFSDEWKCNSNVNQNDNNNNERQKSRRRKAKKKMCWTTRDKSIKAQHILDVCHNNCQKHISTLELFFLFSIPFVHVSQKQILFIFFSFLVTRVNVLEECHIGISIDCFVY